MVVRTKARPKQRTRPAKSQREDLKAPLTALRNHDNNGNPTSLRITTKGDKVKKDPLRNHKRGEHNTIHTKKSVSGRSSEEVAKQAIMDASMQNQTETESYVDENSLLVIPQNENPTEEYSNKLDSNEVGAIETPNRSNKKVDRVGALLSVENDQVHSTASVVKQKDSARVKESMTNEQSDDLGIKGDLPAVESTTSELGRKSTRSQSTRRGHRHATKTGETSLPTKVSSTRLLKGKRKTTSHTTKQKKLKPKSKQRTRSAPRGGGAARDGMNAVMDPGPIRKAKTLVYKKGEFKELESVGKTEPGVTQSSQFRAMSAPRRGTTETLDPIFASDLSRPEESSESFEIKPTQKVSNNEQNPKEAKAEHASIAAPVIGETQNLSKGEKTSNADLSTEAHRTAGEKASSKGAKGKLTKPLNQSTYPRVSRKLTIHELREEAVCRGLERWQLPNDKGDLLSLLGNGSIYLSKTPAWKEVERIKGLIKEEASRRKDPVTAKRCEADRELQGRGTPLRKLLQREDKISIRPQGGQAGEQHNRRSTEVEMNQVHHVHSHTSVHPHPLALTSTVLKHQKPRTQVASCDECASRWTECLYSCERCDFDICKGCFDYRNTTALLRDEYSRKQLEQQENERQEALAREEGRRRLERIKWDADRQFEKEILDPPVSSRSQHGCDMNGFTVWYSHGYVKDGQVQMDFVKEFDSTWPEKEKANKRARYLFYWKNCWGIPPDELSGSGYSAEQEEAEIDGLKSYWIDRVPTKKGSRFWIVSGIPDQAFAQLPRISTSPRDYDNEPSICTIET